MITTVPNRPAPQPMPSDTGNCSPSRDAWRASPNCVIGTGAVSVTCGIWIPEMSVNCNWICVTVRFAAPSGETTTTIGTRNGAVAGQDEVNTGTADTVLDTVEKETFAFADVEKDVG